MTDVTMPLWEGLSADDVAALSAMGLRWVELVAQTGPVAASAPAQAPAMPSSSSPLPAAAVDHAVAPVTPPQAVLTPNLASASPAQAEPSSSQLAPVKPVHSQAGSASDAPKVQAKPALVVAQSPVQRGLSDFSLPSEAQWQADILACQACDRAQQRRQPVWGWAAAPSGRARLCVVSDAPGFADDQDQGILGGAVGQLLDNFLQALGYTRQDIDWVYTVQCASREQAPLLALPKTEHMQACAPFWQQRLRMLKPQALLVLGRNAAQAVLGEDRALNDWRAQTHQLVWPEHAADTQASLPVVVSYSLAYLLQNPVYKGPAWYDWCRALSHVLPAN